MGRYEKYVIMDLGNSIYKVDGDSGQIQYDSRTVPLTIDNVDRNEVIIVDDVCHCIGQGDYEHKSFKATKQNLVPFALYGISSVTDKEDKNITLIINLPIDQIDNKNTIKERLEGHTFAYTFNSPINNAILESREITIDKVGVLAEGVAAYYSLNKSELEDFIIILDIGSKTINFATYTKVGILDIKKSGTLQFGIHDLYNDMSEYYFSEREVKYSITDIDDRIRNGKIEVPDELANKFVDRIINEFRGRRFNDFNDYNFKLCGGGALLINKAIENKVNKADVLSNPVFRNIEGSKKLAKGK